MNVGGHRTFRPSALARDLADYGVVNIGAAGTFVVSKPGSRAGFRKALLARLPFDADVMLCDGRDLIRLEEDHPFAGERPRPDVVRFVSVLSKAGGKKPPLPATFPATGKWLLRVLACDGRFVFGMYRRQMEAIRYLSQIDSLYGMPATTRNWNTIMTVVRTMRANDERTRSRILRVE